MAAREKECKGSSENMTTRDAGALDRTLAALADPTRRAMVERLATGGRMAISDLATPFAMSLPAVLKHVGVLTDAGLVSRVKIGRTVYCHLLSGPIRTALSWLRKYENYVAPSAGEAASASPAATRQSRRKAGAARLKRPAAKTARRPSAASRAPGRTQQPKTRPAPRRGKTAASAPAVKRGARALAAARRQPRKTAADRRRPRR